MKKLGILLLSACLMVCFCLSANANDTVTGNSSYTVIFMEDSCFNEHEQEYIENLLTGNPSDDVATYNLLCTLFGHTNQTEYVTAIRHRVYDAEPRCIEEFYEVEVCTRCSDVKTKLLSRTPIFCCSEGT